MKHHVVPAEMQPNLLTHFMALPLELLQHIIDLTITPFRPPETPLGYIVDPMVEEDFRNQRNKFQKQIQHFRDLGPQVTGYGYVEKITKIWRGEWESCMSSMISDDKDEWARIDKAPMLITVIGSGHDLTMTGSGNNLSEKDIYEYAELKAQTYTVFDSNFDKRVAMDAAVWYLRHTRVDFLHRTEAFDKAYERHDQIQQFDRHIRQSQSNWSSGLQKALGWEEEE